MPNHLAPVLVLSTLLASPVVAEDYTFLPSLPVTGPETMLLLDIDLCGSRMLAVGERGLVVHSDDGGGSWRQAEVPVSQTLTAVACLPGGHAWAVGHGGVILFSADRGEHWRLQFDGNQANQQWLDSVEVRHSELQTAVDVATEAERDELEIQLEDTGYALEDARQALATGPADPFLDVWFRDVDYGLAVGAYGMLYLSTDGGNSWQLRAGSADNPDRYHYYSVAAAASGTLFLSGEAGLLFRSRDAGASWERLDPGYDGSLFGLLPLENGDVLCFGLRGNILRSEDDGDSWAVAAVSDNPGFSLYDGVQLGDGRIVLVGAAGAILSSADDGQHFTSRTAQSRSALSGVIVEQTGRLLAVGMEGLQALTGGTP